MALSIVADVGYHATHGLHPHAHASGLDVAMSIHLAAGVGMITVLTGLIAAGIRSTRAHQKEEIR
jgi:hypothetical protein